MRPVPAKYPVSQAFGSGATAGVAPSKNPNSGMGYYVWLYGNYQPHGHAGLDIACPIGTPIYAIEDGVVLYAGWSEDLPGYGDVRKWLLYYNFGGIITVIQHDGWVSIVAHQSNNDHVKPGDGVKAGQLIGLSGNTKTRYTTVAPHVHVEALVHLDYRTNVRQGIIYGRVDPVPYFGGLSALGTITPEDEVTPEDIKAIAQAVADIIYPAMTTQNEQFHNATRANVNEHSDRVSYSDRVFNQSVVNQNTDRVINKLEGK